jgi:hypothetical protein
MSGLKRTLTASDIEDSHHAGGSSDFEGTDCTDSATSLSSTAETTEWEEAASASATSHHRRYRSGSGPDIRIQEPASWRVSLVKAWDELGFALKLVIMIVTPIAARQLGSMTARRLFSRWFGPVHFH